MLMLFENDKGGVGMADVAQRLGLAYMEQAQSLLNYLKQVKDKWAYHDGDSELYAFSFLARSFMQNYFKTEVYTLAGECANYQLNLRVFLNWT